MRGGVRGRWRVERGKHGEVSGYAGGSYKGESGDGCAQGAWRRGYWGPHPNGRVQTHAVFVDGLPEKITKRELYKLFGRNDFIVDIFGSKLTVNPAKNRGWEANQKQRPLCTEWASSNSKNGRRVFQKWIPVIKTTNNGKQVRIHNEGDTTGEHRRKEVMAMWAEDQRLLLQCSLFGVCVKPIKPRKVMNALLDNWKGPGDIEVRDVGPYRCLVTFSNPEVRDLAMEHELLYSVFDEVRNHWNTFWCLSRRVWIEVIGMPISLWCPENFENVAKLWGKVLRFDDRTEEPKSFTIGRILIDSYQWEHINEWISIKIENQTFEVHAKEVGPKMYSIELHPNWDPDDCESTSMEFGDADGEKTAFPVEDKDPQLSDHREPIYDANDDQLSGLDAKLNANERSVGRSKFEYDSVAESKRLLNAWVPQGDDDMLLGMGTRLTNPNPDPMLIEAQLCGTWVRTQQELNNNNWIGMHLDPDRASGIGDTQSSSSSPYPPGFGPCSGDVHIHSTARVQGLTVIVRETPILAAVGVGVSSLCGADLSDDNLDLPPHEGNNFSAVRNCSMETVPIVEVKESRRIDREGFPVGDGAVAVAGGEKTSTDSDETLYRINKDVGYMKWLEGEVAGLYGEDAELYGENVEVNGGYRDQWEDGQNGPLLRGKSAVGDSFRQINSVEEELELEES
ncbi:hypothetical protein PIB30_009207 [Stylosanthes scabra]|uniref:RRM domain-containing protein n=1 Tax=Stylosanthes scabra TaxID=79078 RepID=A0ABU6Z4V8_9FABA|nr:hypothetical protein [Stylosanthes scabra]